MNKTFQNVFPVIVLLSALWLIGLATPVHADSDDSIKLTDSGPDVLEKAELNHLELSQRDDRTALLQPGGTITIKKQTTPGGGAGFDFTDDIEAPFGFTLNDGGEQTFNVPVAGPYQVTEIVPNGWQLTEVTCTEDVINNSSGSGTTATINLEDGETVTCTFKNTQLAQLTLDKTVVNDHGGTKGVGDFLLFINGNPVTSGVAVTLSPGTYTASETNRTDYTASAWGGHCASNGTITLAPGDNKTCTITNNDIAPQLLVKVNVTNDNGGTAAPGDFTVSVTGTEVNPAFFTGSSDGTMVTLDAGNYNVSTSRAGYTITPSGICNGSIDIGGSQTCTLTANDIPGTLTVIKQVTNNNGGEKTVSDFPLFVDGNPVTSGVATPVATGAHTVSELNVSGYAATFSGDCNANGQVTVNAGENKTCIITNDDQPGSITIVKDAVPNDPQAFSFSGALGAFTLDDDPGNNTHSHQATFPNLASGVYAISEAPVNGWTLTGLTCEDPSSNSSTNGSTATVNLQLGETVICTFTNTKLGSITIVKDTVPDNSRNFAFTSNIPGATSFSLDDDTNATLPNTRTFSGLSAGSYSVSEMSVTGWTLTSLICSDPTNNSSISGATATIVLDVGESVTCTFTNTQLGSITIVKDAVPNHAQDFAFTTTGTGLSPFSLDDDSTATLPNSRTFSNLSLGSYSVMEGNVTGWILTSLGCTDPTNNSSTGGATATIIVDAGDTITCTFTNTQQPGSITIVKDAVPNHAQDFAFSTTGSGLSNFSLDDDADAILSHTRSFTGLLPGNYSVTEGSVAGWTLTNLTCTDPNGDTTISGSTATINLAAGETVTCTFTNTQQPGSITIVKDAVPNHAQDFAFSTTGSGLSNFSLDDDADAILSHTRSFTGLLPGNYSVTEGSLVGWTLDNLTCNDPDSGSNGNATTRVATIDLDAGESITCTFINTVQSSVINIDKKARTAKVNPGVSVTYDYTVTNIAQAPLHQVAVSDDRCSPVTRVSGDNNSNNLLEVGEIWRYTCAVVLTADTTNTARVTALNPVNAPVEDIAIAFVDVQPTVNLDKTVTPAQQPEANAVFTFTLTLQNTSQEPVMITALTDSQISQPNQWSCAALLNTQIAANGTVSCRYTVTHDTPGTHNNTATVTVRDDENNSVSDNAAASVSVIESPFLSVTKTATPAAVPESGGNVVFVVTVHNNSILEIITVNKVEDNRFGDIGGSCSPPLPAQLLPGGQINCGFTQLLAGDAGTPHINIATATGVNLLGQPVTDSGQTAVTFTDVPSSMTVSKTANLTVVPPSGGEVVFTLQVANTSAVDALTLNSLNDSVFGNVADASNPALSSTNCVVPQIVAVGQSYSCQFSAVVSGTIGGVHTNLVTATATDDDGVSLQAIDDAAITITGPAITASKQDQLIQDANDPGIANPGDVLGYTVVIRNTGNAAGVFAFTDVIDANTTLLAASVNTTQGTPSLNQNTLSVNLGEIAPNGQVTIQFNVQINNPLPAGVIKVANQGLVTSASLPTVATDDPDTLAPGDATETQVGARPLIAVAKTDSVAVDADRNGIASPGDVLEYRISVANNGNQAATNVVLDDTPDEHTALVVGSIATNPGNVVKGNRAGDTTVTINLGSLLGGQTAIITFRVTVLKPLPVNITQVGNQALVSGANFSPVQSDDPATPVKDDPTQTLLTAGPNMAAFKRDTLLVDADNNGTPSPGDALVYNITIVNSGNQAAAGVAFSDTPDPNTTLVAGSVQVSQGQIARGNTPDDTQVAVNLGLIAAGERATITFHVIVANPLPPGTTRISNQGTVFGSNFGATPTDDPDTAADADLTSTPVTTAGTLEVTKRDFLYIDADGDELVSPGDTLLYIIKLVNQGNVALPDVALEDTPDANTQLVSGRMQVSQGTVELGNGTGDTRVVVRLSSLPPNTTVNIGFQVTVAESAGVSVSNQAVAVFTNPNSSPANVTVLSDDPDTPAAGDPTVTPIGTSGQASGPTPIYMPLIRK